MLVFATPACFAIFSMLAPATPCSIKSSRAAPRIARSTDGSRGRPCALPGLRVVVEVLTSVDSMRYGLTVEAILYRLNTFEHSATRPDLIMPVIIGRRRVIRARRGIVIARRRGDCGKWCSSDRDGAADDCCCGRKRPEERAAVIAMRRRRRQRHDQQRRQDQSHRRGTGVGHCWVLLEGVTLSWDNPRYPGR